MTTMLNTRLAVPRWANWAAHAALLATLPSGLWRIAMGLQIPVGFTEKGLTAFDIPGWGTVFVFGLSALAEALAFLTLGLVRPWGEVVPRWIPFLGGRPIPVFAAVLPAAAGAIALMILVTPAAFRWADTGGGTMSTDIMVHGGPYTVIMGVCYAPLLLWGPLLAAVTVHYYRRRTAPTSH